MFYAAQNFIQRTMERMVGVEMNAIYLCIRNKLANVEVTVDNMSWVVSEGLEEPGWMFDLSKRMLKNNPSFWGSGVAFMPYYYSNRDKFFEPYAVHGGGDTIMTLQVGRKGVDYTKKEYYRVPVEQGTSHWSEPYVNQTDDKTQITTYSTPIRNAHNRIVGVVFADIATNWLEDIMNEEKTYKSTQRFLMTDQYNMLAGRVNPVFREVLKILKADSDKSGYFMMTSKDGVKHHVFYTPVGGKTDWVLINILDDSEVFGRLRFMQIMLMLPLILGLFFAIFIVWRSSHNWSRLKKVNAEKERIDSELQVASQIQQSMLPQGEFSAESVDLEGFLKPAREVGGDIYDYFIRDEKLFFCIGDVSGKGAPSAILMAVTHALFRSASAHESNPGRIMQTINEIACQGNDSNMFVTMFIGVLDLPTGRLRYCDAGHDAPAIMDDGKWKMLDVIPHLPIGVFLDVKYGVQELSLQPDSTIFLYTDGLTEAKNTEHKQYGLERIQKVLQECTDKRPQEILKAVTTSVEGFVKHAEQSDDLTMLAIRYTPKQFNSTLTETLTIKNDVHEVKRFSDFMKSALEKLDVDKSLARQLRLAVEEAVVNVIDYAYPTDTEGDITINMMSDGHTLRFQIIDAGVAFDPTAKQKTDTTLSVEERQIGGLGILLVRELMDSINYERTDGKNVLTLIKKFK
jgi:sigma-B regulation protein RsbU (phosphoserine phosphatase)